MQEKYTDMDDVRREDLQYILDILETMDEKESSGGTWGSLAAAMKEATEKKDPFPDRIESLLYSALLVYSFDKDADLLRSSMQKIASYAAALPAERIRPWLRRSSQRIDLLLSFTDVWQPPCWEKMLGCPEPGLDEEWMDEMFGIAPGDCEYHSVPYLAFLLAGTGFPFTGEELSGIRSGAGMSVGELRGIARGKEGGAQ